MFAPERFASAPAVRAKVVIADDDEELRESLRMTLARDGRIAVVGEADGGAALLELLPNVICDTILLDLAMPGMDGLAVLEALSRGPAHPPVVVLSTFDDAGHVDQALALGAAGYVLKSARVGQIVDAVQAAIAGGAYLHPTVARAMLDRHLVRRVDGMADHNLSPRQLQVLHALCEGLTTKEVADRLGLAETTVPVYIKQLYERLGVTSRAGAVATALRRGIVR